MKRISSLIFDFGNVLTLPQDLNAIAKMASILGGASVEALSAAYAAGRNAYDRGDVGALEYWTGVCECLGVTMDSTLFDELKRLDVASWFNVNHKMLAFVRQLRPRLRRIALLSNINEEGVRQLEVNAPWLEGFDATVLSCEHHLLKPEPAIFELCLKMIGEKPGDCLFVDDIAANIEGARAIGLNGHHFKGLSGLEAELVAEYELVR